MKKLRVLVLMHHYLVPPADARGRDLATADWKTEYDVISALRALGHDVHALGVNDDPRLIQMVRDDFKPDIAFNLMEAFHEVGTFDMNVVSYLELLRLPYTGCNPRGTLLSRDKALSKKLLAYHGIPTPGFAVVRRGRTTRAPGKLGFPLIVKSLTEESSNGIAQASVVHDECSLRERVGFIHESLATDAIVEQFIEGRELYVGVVGNERPEALPVWEMNFNGMPEGAHRIATRRAKWSGAYQERYGITTSVARNLPRAQGRELRMIARRAYHALDMSGYARMDFRLDGAGKACMLEANANPQLARGEDLAESAKRAGLKYTALIQRIVNLGLRWDPERAG